MVRLALVTCLLPLGLSCEPLAARQSETSTFTVDPPYGVEVRPPLPPAAPQLPVLTPCPVGWAEVPGRLVTTCEPGAVQTCPVGEAQLPGQQGCAPLGSACPASGWPDALPATGLVLFVRPGASGGDGSRASPVASIDEALSVAAGRPVTLALSQGTHLAGRAMPAGTTLVGACAQRTVLTAPATASAVLTTSAELVVRSVQLTAPTAGIEARGVRAQVTLEDVALHDLVAFALGVEGGARLEGRRLTVDRTTLDPMAVNGALVVFGQGTLNVTDAVITNAGAAGARVEGPGTLTLSNVALGDTADGLAGAVGWALSAQGGTLTATGVVVERGGGGFSLSNGATGKLEGVVIRGTLRDDAIKASGATFTGERLLLESTGGYPLRSGEHAQVTARDVVTRRCFASQARAGATLTLERALVEEPLSPVLTTNGAQSRLVVSDFTVTPPPANTTITQFGTGLIGYLDAHLSLTRAHFEQVVGNAATMTQRATGTFTDVTIDEGVPSRPGGHALTVSTAATVRLERVKLRNMFGFGVGAWDAQTTLTLEDVDIEGTTTVTGNGTAAVVADGARATMTRVRLANNDGAGLLVGRGGSLTAEEVFVSATTLACEATSSCAGRVAVGLGSYSGGALSVRQFVVSTSGIGAQVSGASLGLVDGDVSFNEIGLSVLDPTFDLAAVSSGVLYRHNLQRLSSQNVPLPEIPPPPPQ